MKEKYNTLYFIIEGKIIEVLPIGNKDPKQMVVELEKAYEVASLGKESMAYYYSESKMNKGDE